MNFNNFFLIAGPCMLESRELGLTVAQKVKEISEKYQLPFIFKSSFDKANRSSIASERGPGLEKGLRWLQEIKKELNVPVLSDVHTPEMVNKCAEVLDVIQIPAFLARQTDFYIEAAKTQKAVNVKKGQFMSPYEMENVVNKFIQSGGNQQNITITERGSFFGYGNLVVDFRSIKIIKDLGVKYIYDATHSLQLPAARSSSSGGNREFLENLTLAQVAGGADGLFLETHPDVENALSDKETQYPLTKLEGLIKKITSLSKFTKANLQ